MQWGHSARNARGMPTVEWQLRHRSGVMLVDRQILQCIVYLRSREWFFSAIALPVARGGPLKGGPCVRAGLHAVARSLRAGVPRENGVAARGCTRGACNRLHAGCVQLVARFVVLCPESLCWYIVASVSVC